MEMSSLAITEHYNIPCEATTVHDSFVELMKAQNISPKLRSLFEGLCKEFENLRDSVIINVFVDSMSYRTRDKNLESSLENNKLIAELRRQKGLVEGMGSFIEAMKGVGEVTTELQGAFTQSINHDLGTSRGSRSLLKKLHRELNREDTFPMPDYFANIMRRSSISKNLATQPNRFGLQERISGFLGAVDHIVDAATSLRNDFTQYEPTHPLYSLLKGLSEELEKLVANSSGVVCKLIVTFFPNHTVDRPIFHSTTPRTRQFHSPKTSTS